MSVVAVAEMITENVAADTRVTIDKLTYEAYCRMTPEEKAKVLYEGMEKYITGLRVAEILKDMAKMEMPYSGLTDKEKAELFDFQVEDNDYNLKLYLAVVKAVGIRQSMYEMYEDYQRIYDKTVERQMEKETDRRNEERGRGR